MLEQGPIVVVLWSTFVATLGYLLLRILDRQLGNHVDPRIMHGIWLLLVLRMIVPLRAPDWFAFSLSRTWTIVLISIWSTGFTAAFLLRLWQGYQLRRKILEQEVTLPEWLHRDFIDIRKRMRIGTRPVLLVTGSHYGPLLCGILRPLIAFPFSFIKRFQDKVGEQDELRRSVCHVLRHELCHLRRGDLWFGWFWVMARSVHWFNPLLARAGNSLRIWQEFACDLRAMHSFEELDPSQRVKEQINYAQMLLDTAALSQNFYRPLEAAASVVEPLHEIERRISMITNTSYSLARRLVANSTALIAILLLLFFSCPGIWSSQGRAVASTGSIPENTADAVDQVVKGSESGKEAPASDSNESAKTTEPECQVLSCVDETNESVRSLGASGHAVLFEKRPEGGKYLGEISLFCGRYGLPQPPRDKFNLYILKEKEQKDPIDLSAENLLVIAKVPVPYSEVERTGEELEWYSFSTPSIELPQGRFLIAAAFNPHQTKGIYLGIDEDAADTDACKSFVGLPKEGYKPFDAKGQWMIRAKLCSEPVKGKKVIKPADAKPAFEEEKVDESKYKTVSFCGKESDGKQSYGGSGPVVMIPLKESLGLSKEKLEKCKLAGLSLRASRYGSGFDPQNKKVDVVITDADGEILHKESFPYDKFTYNPRNVALIFPKPIELKEYIQNDGKLYVGLDPKAHQRKGIYFHYTKTSEDESHSSVLTPGIEISSPLDREWMIRFYFVPPVEKDKKE